MGKGGEPGLLECFRLSGLIKILESCAIFVCMMLHRIGNRGNQVTMDIRFNMIPRGKLFSRLVQVWFGANDQYLDQKDPIYEAEVDIEILGGCVMAFVIITPMILLAYAIEGTDAIQRTSLDSLFTFTAAATLIATGSKCQIIFFPDYLNDITSYVCRYDLFRLEQCQRQQHS